MKIFLSTCAILVVTAMHPIHVFAANSKTKFTEPEMATIPAGRFIMGGTRSNEQPKHKVFINKFKLAKHEVTVGEFRQFVQDTNHKTKDICWIWQEVTEDHNWGINRKPGSWDLDKYAPSDDHPVMCVTWQDAKAYATWLNKKTGKNYRLPTESEWEYAARAGSQKTYFMGDDATKLCTYANILDTKTSIALARDYRVFYEAIACDDYAAYTAKVGSYKPNKFGLFDMIGNVSEFVEDCEHTHYVGAPNDGTAWTEGCNVENPMVIVRGGSYASKNGARLAAREHAGPDNPSSLGEGFRLAMSIN